MDEFSKNRVYVGNFYVVFLDEVDFSIGAYLMSTADVIAPIRKKTDPFSSVYCRDSNKKVFPPADNRMDNQ